MLKAENFALVTYRLQYLRLCKNCTTLAFQSNSDEYQQSENDAK